MHIGTALSATSTAITVNVLKEMGKLQTDAAKVIIGAAIFDDNLGLLAVILSTQLAYGSFSLTSITVIIIKAVLYIVLSAAFGIFVVRWYIERLDKCAFTRNYPEFLVIFSLIMAFLYTLVAELTGLSCIIGACIAVISCSSIQLIHSNEFRKGTECLQIIFSAIFFVSLGVITDFRTLIPALVWLLVILTIVAIISMVVGCWIPAKFFGISGKDSLII
jgi:Kef-type K+ transport system membrane component KefB